MVKIPADLPPIASACSHQDMCGTASFESLIPPIGCMSSPSLAALDYALGWIFSHRDAMVEERVMIQRSRTRKEGLCRAHTESLNGPMAPDRKARLLANDHQALIASLRAPRGLTGIE